MQVFIKVILQMPVKLVYSELFQMHADAITVEHKVNRFDAAALCSPCAVFILSYHRSI